MCIFNNHYFIQSYTIMKKILFIFILLAIISCAKKESLNIKPFEAQLIPQPVKHEHIDTPFILGDQLNITIQTDDTQTHKYVTTFITFLSDAGIKINSETVNPPKNSLHISLNDKTVAEIGEEGYQLEINQDAIKLNANDAAGIFNGLQTLRQFFPPYFKIDENNPIALEGAKIVDYPRFAWRGLMLDVSRHFFSVEDVKAYIDKMSKYKLNTFHWHLTDDQGWRIEIKSLPKLTEIGAWRVERHGRFGGSRPSPKPGEKATYGGFYTHEQIKDIVRYASDRNITIVPEIDMPGHMMAALAAYPEMSVKKEPKFVAPGSKFSEWYGNGRFKMLIENTLNPADENVYEFIDKIFTEVAALFPGEYIHMGGDEAYHGYWKADPKVRKFMKQNGIEDSHELQSYFVKRVEKIISSKGKKTIGWDEILDGGLAEGAAVMSWRGMKRGIEAAKLGHNVVMSPTTFAYLDYTQGDHSVENKIYANLSLEKTYSFEPIPEGIDAKYVLGGQGNLWTEVIPNLQYAYYMTYPRAFAISETFWSPKESKNWESFIDRTETHFLRFEADNSNISKAVLDPIVQTYKEGDKLMCKLSNNASNTKIYYTIDNTYPAQYGVKYTVPFEIPKGNLNLHTQTFRGGNPLGRQLKIKREDLVKRIGRKELVLIPQD